MADIVCVHGALRPQVDTPSQLAAQWYPALHQGLAAAGAQALDFSFQCVWYADLLRDPEDNSWPAAAADLRQAFIGLGGQTVRSWLDALLNSAAAQHIGDWAVQLFLQQAWRYLNDPMPRAESRLRLSAALSDETRVVIAHSLGSIVAWETLMRETNQVDTLITVGSPLAMPNVVADKLQPPPTGGRLLRPKIRRWVNLSHVDDWVAHPAALDKHVHGDVDDFLLQHEVAPHHIEHYLSSRELADAVVAALSTQKTP